MPPRSRRRVRDRPLLPRRDRKAVTAAPAKNHTRSETDWPVVVDGDWGAGAAERARCGGSGRAGEACTRTGFGRCFAAAVKTRTSAVFGSDARAIATATA